MCDVATQGVWANALNAMFLAKEPSVTGTKEQLSRLCRCRPQQVEVAALELHKFKVAIVEWQTDSITIASRRLIREMQASEAHRQAGKQGAKSRWQTDSKPIDKCMAISASRYASSTSGTGKGVQGEGDFKSAMATVPIQLSEDIGKHLDFAEMVFEDWLGKDGRNGSGIQVRFAAHLRKRWFAEGEQWRNGCHKGRKDGNQSKPKSLMEKDLIRRQREVDSIDTTLPD